MMALLKVLALLCVCALGHCQMYDTLYATLFLGYLKTIPRTSMRDTVNVTINPYLIEVKSVDEITGLVDLEIWLHLGWTDRRLSWNPHVYDNITTIDVPSCDVWIPDVTLYNGEITNLYKEAQVVLHNDGSIMYIPKTNFRVRCDVRENSNTSTFYCYFKVGSWVYNGVQLDVNFPSNRVDLSSYKLSKFVTLTGATVKKDVEHYPCCEEPYPILFYTITFQGRVFP